MHVARQVVLVARTRELHDVAHLLLDLVDDLVRANLGDRDGGQGGDRMRSNCPGLPFTPDTTEQDPTERIVPPAATRNRDSANQQPKLRPGCGDESHRCGITTPLTVLKAP